MRLLFVFVFLSSLAFGQIKKAPKCEEIDGYQTKDIKLLPKNFTGVNKMCKNGYVYEISNFKNGKRDGLHREYFFTGNHFGWTGQLRFEIINKNGQVDGYSKQWNDKGILISHYKAISGKLEGEWWRWHDNGQKKQLNTFKNGISEGLFMKWYENGLISEKGFYKNNQVEGLYESFYKSGYKKAKAYFKNGKIDGLWEGWYKNGNSSWKAEMKEGEKNGLYKKWNENGNLKSESIYKDNVLVSKKCYDLDGNQIKCD